LSTRTRNTEEGGLSAKLTNRELDIMAVLWQEGSGTVSDVTDRLDAELAYSTVLTMLRTLETKGHVRHEQEGKAYRYIPVTQPDDFGERALGRVLDKIFQGSRELLVTRLMADENVSPDELRRIRELLDERLEELEG